MVSSTVSRLLTCVLGAADCVRGPCGALAQVGDEAAVYLVIGCGADDVIDPDADHHRDLAVLIPQDIDAVVGNALWWATPTQRPTSCRPAGRWVT